MYSFEPKRFKEVPRDWGNWFVISWGSLYLKPDSTNLRKNNQIFRYTEGRLIIFL